MKPKRKNGKNGLDPRRLKSGGWVLFAVFIFFMLFGVGGVWGYFARLSGAVIANGAVSPQSGIKTVQHPDGGVVREIRVKEGERVKRGQILLALEDADLRGDLGVVETRLYAAMAEMARLTAERDGAQEPRFPDELTSSDAPRAAEAMRTQRALFKARRKMLADQKHILRQKIAALRKGIEGLEAELKARERQAKLNAEEVETVSALFEKGQALKPRLLALKQKAAELEGRRGRLIGEIARARENIAEISLRLTALDRDFLARILDRLAVLQKEAGVLRQQRMELRRKLEQTQVRAPVSGHVLDLAIRTVGGVISPRQPILRIVPENEPLVIEARVRPVDIDQVYVGQPARVVFSAFSRRSVPPVKGRVRMVSPAPLADEASKQAYYRCEVIVPSDELRLLGSGHQLVPGMPAEIFLTTAARSPLRILLSPLEAASRRVLRGD